MKRRVLLTVVLVIAILTIARAQTQTKLQITGRLIDYSNKEPLPNAAVALLEVKDSSIAATVVADAKGLFNITGAKPGNYVLVVSYMGYQQLTRNVHIQDTSRLIALGTLTLKRKGLNLNEVEIVDVKPPITIKEDTVEYNAGSFKTRENALLEELLKKLPGIQVEKDGTIKANGETVKKVLVDGKPFFGDDPKMATRNLPADIVDKIQLIDRKSEQAQFTGIADGEIEKTLNFTIKQDRKKGVFGRATAGYGSDERFSVNASMNRFRQTQQLSIMGGGNNTNNTGFSFSDGFNFGGGAKGGGGTGNTGLNRNWNGGINYSDNLAKGLRISGSYFMSDMQRDNERRSERENRHKPDSFSYVNSNSASLSNNRNHRVNARIEYDIDSFHSLIVTPNISFGSGDNFSESRNTTLNNNRDTVNNGRNMNKTTANSPSINGTALFRKKFDKKGRTFSTNLNFGANSNERESINQSQTSYLQRNGTFRNDTLDQKVIQDNSSKTLGVRMSYTEPVFIDRFLELNYGYNYNANSSNRTTYDKGKDAYDQLNDSLTNAFNNVYSNHQAGISIMTQKLRYNYTLGMNVQFNNLNSENITKDSTIQQHTVNISPLAQMNYNFSKNRRMRLAYRGQTQQPSLEQLQPVPDNSNPLFVKLGNPDLKPSFNNNLSVNYNNFDPVSMRSFFASLTGTFTLNKIVNNTAINDQGIQTSRPVNVNGNYNVNAYMVNGFSINRQQKTTINTNTYAGLTRDVSFLNNQKNFTQTLNITQAASFNYMYKEVFDMAAGGSVNYNRARFSNNKANNTNYFNYNFSLDFNLNLPGGIIIGGDVDHTINTGRTEGYNLQYTLANGFISKTLFKAKQGLVKFQVFDLFNQNVSVNRTVMDNYTEDSETKVLQRYFMVSFSYFLNRFGGKAPKGQRGDRMMEGPRNNVRF
ncbi:TonB-dependent receptor [Chitinophaga niabensis]|uniref:Outer membrane receptor proteins, mostly Fe transport n=1 Tax=Chitinophaga niabensis TaxID=536979 RepID=A0A1N6JR58_9BACT|nr:TonB-dependent receptor [Chitinophaga niabensis]SIO46679.1 Outer membrane receptor proteins, mostly Fe transport [Chitinophaga niabensis]